LLRRHAYEISADHIVTAHHADDQAETILFRLLRGSGPAGLAGMAEATDLGGVRLLRPLLAVHKAELIDYCRTRRQSFFSDPSNENPRYARARLRQIAPLLAQEGLDTDKLVRLGQRAARSEAALQHAALALRACLQAERGDGRFKAPLRSFAEAPDEILLRLLELEISAVSPGRPRRLNRLESLATALGTALRTGTAFVATQAGTKLSLDRYGTLLIRREGARRRGLRPGTPNEGQELQRAASGPDFAGLLEQADPVDEYCR
jgi:tRNA(Ile)-lysidine synthase